MNRLRGITDISETDFRGYLFFEKNSKISKYKNTLLSFFYQIIHI